MRLKYHHARPYHHYFLSKPQHSIANMIRYLLVTLVLFSSVLLLTTAFLTTRVQSKIPLALKPKYVPVKNIVSLYYRDSKRPVTESDRTLQIRATATVTGSIVGFVLLRGFVKFNFIGFIFFVFATHYLSTKENFIGELLRSSGVVTIEIFDYIASLFEEQIPVELKQKTQDFSEPLSKKVQNILNFTDMTFEKVDDFVSTLIKKRD